MQVSSRIFTEGDIPPPLGIRCVIWLLVGNRMVWRLRRRHRIQRLIWWGPDTSYMHHTREPSESNSSPHCNKRTNERLIDLRESIAIVDEKTGLMAMIWSTMGVWKRKVRGPEEGQQVYLNHQAGGSSLTRIEPWFAGVKGFCDSWITIFNILQPLNHIYSSFAH